MAQRLFFDVDGVLLNFEHAFVGWINDQYGMGLPEDYETEDWYFNDILTREQCKEAWNTFLGSDAAAGMKPYLDAAAFNELTGGRPVHLLTNFPEQHFDKRIANLETIGFRYDSLHHCGFHGFKKGTGVAKKSQMVAELLERGERGLFVDDHPDNCLDVADNCESVEVWLMSRRFNREFAHPEVRRAHSWNCVIGRLGDSQPTAADAEPLDPTTTPTVPLSDAR